MTLNAFLIIYFSNKPLNLVNNVRKINNINPRQYLFCCTEMFNLLHSCNTLQITQSSQRSCKMTKSYLIFLCRCQLPVPSWLLERRKEMFCQISIRISSQGQLQATSGLCLLRLDIFFLVFPIFSDLFSDPRLQNCFGRKYC